MDSIIPIYYQIERVLKSRIINEEYKLGEKICSENQLAKEFGVTRLTVRQAISLLNQEGLLVSKRGKGTFVTDNKDLLNSFSYESAGFIDEIYYQVEKPKTMFATVNIIELQNSVREKLNLDKKEKMVVQIKRLRFLKNKPFCYLINYLPVELGSKIIEGELYKKSFMDILEKDNAIHFTEAFQTIQATYADQEIAKNLEVPLGSSLLFVERFMYMKRRKPVLLSQFSYPGNSIKYIARFKRVKRKNKNVWERWSL